MRYRIAAAHFRRLYHAKGLSGAAAELGMSQTGARTWAVRTGCRPRMQRSSRIDITGLEVGRLRVLGPARNASNALMWAVVCACGAAREVRGRDLRSGRTLSCGCIRRGMKYRPREDALA
jgi:hypothetical protein